MNLSLNFTFNILYYSSVLQINFLSDQMKTTFINIIHRNGEIILYNNIMLHYNLNFMLNELQYRKKDFEMKLRAKMFSSILIILIIVLRIYG